MESHSVTCKVRTESLPVQLYCSITNGWINDVWVMEPYVSTSLIPPSSDCIFIQSVVCLTTVHSVFQTEFCTQCDLVLPLSSFNISSYHYNYPIYICLLLLLFFIHSLFPPVTCFRRHFLRKVWPIQFAFLHLILRRIFRSWLCVIALWFILQRSYWLRLRIV